ncbi:MAG: T9SS type A sorting domain-containing protein [Bacteroidia bacterium]|nr:T9SS type A sorting domain-containing protein [Bacteroidia bacterium]
MKKVFSIVFLLFSIQSFAQSVVPCFTDELYVNAVRENPLLKVEEDRGNQIAREYASRFSLAKAGIVIYIPVVFHIVHKNSSENITQAQINDCIRVLNEDFRKKAGTNGGTSTDIKSVDAEIEFRLAQVDPTGKPTDGVNRIYNASETINGTDVTKTLSYWDSNKYFNIWVVNIINSASAPSGSIILGYAQFPSSRNSRPSTDGIIVRADQIGNIGMGQTGQAGRTVTHEAGHWCGLYHPFQGGCVGGTSSNCSSQGDQVCDTPPVAVSTSGCPPSQNSCSNDLPDLADNIKNYMDYADGTCMDMYTAGQAVRMKSQMNTYRANIYSTNNLSAAGINADGTYKPLTSAVIKAPVLIDFNEQVNRFEIENFMNPTTGWKTNYQVGYNDGSSMRFNAYDNGANSVLNTRDEFHTSNIDITTLTKPILTFQIAHAKRLGGSSDQINMFVSNSYGRTEVLAKVFTVADMETAPVKGDSAFVPTSSQWKKLSLDLSDYKTYNNFRVRFELQARRGNNTYIDNIQIGEFVNAIDEANNAIKISINPNPTNGISNLVFTNVAKSIININLYDMTGKLVKNISNTSYSAGEHIVELNSTDLTKGIYFIKVQQNEHTYTTKWIVN